LNKASNWRKNGDILKMFLYIIEISLKTREMLQNRYKIILNLRMFDHNLNEPLYYFVLGRKIIGFTLKRYVLK